MARIQFIKAGVKRKKKWQFYKLRARQIIFKLSILGNIYFLSVPYHGLILTNIYEIYTKALPILEALIKQLPL